ncbi:MAG: hypothetical protein ACXWEY_01780 [Bacteroidia bacterium]
MGKLLVVLIFCGFVFSTCNKDEESFCTDNRTTKILPHQKDFFYFKTGSWWVYEEEKTGEKDSIWIVLDTHERFRGHPEIMFSNRRCTEKFQIIFLNKKYNNLDSGAYIQLDIWSSFIRGEFDVMEGGKLSKGQYNTRISYRNSEYVKDWYSDSNTYFEDITSIQVKGKIFNNILHIDRDPMKPHEGYDWLQEAWYAKDIYLVKFRKTDSTTWNLIKYNIVK